ncbi:MAG: hypothetical protein HYY26_06500 [Acidobacteria bacterium]|nr:hypothetical protein [Acidobacteriota bacterium]
MALIVIGGHTRNIGKTQLAVEIIRAFPAAAWTAVKITQFGHGICSLNGESCDCAVDEHTFALEEEHDASGRTDTSRFLVAGAQRSLWVRTKQGRLAEAMPAVRARLAGARNVVMESNSVLHFLRPDLYLPVLDFSNPDFKDSAREFLDRADAYVVLAPPPAAPTWDDVSLKPLAARPVFVVWPERLLPPALQEFIASRLFRGSRVASRGSRPTPATKDPTSLV